MIKSSRRLGLEKETLTAASVIVAPESNVLVPINWQTLALVLGGRKMATSLFAECRMMDR
jgi:hypothetical protein